MFVDYDLFIIQIKHFRLHGLAINDPGTGHVIYRLNTENDNADISLCLVLEQTKSARNVFLSFETIAYWV